MKLKGIHLFLILLLALVLASSLGRIVEGMASEKPVMETNKPLPSTTPTSASSSNEPQGNIAGSSYYSPVNGGTDSTSVKVVTLDNGQTIYATPQNTIHGVPQNKIPPGQEDLYILKSQVVPPVCPACPPLINNCEGNKKCAPCPPCGRCPEPAFECVKRPTYTPDNPYLPMPVLADFSQFGM